MSLYVWTPAIFTSSVTANYRLELSAYNSWPKMMPNSIKLKFFLENSPVFNPVLSWSQNVFNKKLTGCDLSESTFSAVPLSWKMEFIFFQPKTLALHSLRNNPRKAGKFVTFVDCRCTIICNLTSVVQFIKSVKQSIFVPITCCWTACWNVAIFDCMFFVQTSTTQALLPHFFRSLKDWRFKMRACFLSLLPFLHARIPTKVRCFQELYLSSQFRPFVLFYTHFEGYKLFMNKCFSW